MIESREEEEKAKKREFNIGREELQESLKEVLEYERDFPEVMETVKRAVGELTATGVGAALNPGVLRVLNPSMSLKAFDEYELLSSPPATRHNVYKALEGDTWFAVKEYTVSDVREMMKSLNEAALLQDLRHPHITDLTAIFFDTDYTEKMYLQMPFYANGQLDS